MDFWKALRDLKAHRDELDKAIAKLERLTASFGGETKSRRGRKHMPEAERRIVAERMKRYWEQRRKAKKVQGKTSDVENGTATS